MRRLLVLLVVMLAAGGCGGSGGSPRDSTAQESAGADANASAAGEREASDSSSGVESNGSDDSERPRLELPRGGRDLVPKHRIVALYGAPQAEELGALGRGSPSQAADRAVDQAGDYKEQGRPVLPALQLIATIANQAPGADGLYRTRQDDKTIRRYLKAARKEKALLILDVQPGRADFMDEARHLHQWLNEPDVGLAIDPEWSMDAAQVPGQTIGDTDAKTINDVSGYLAKEVREHDLPEKVLIVHRFTDDMIADEKAITTRDGVTIVEMADGFGTPQAKRSKYDRFTADADGLHEGFKLFYKEDTNLMSVREVMSLTPEPDVVVYE